MAESQAVSAALALLAASAGWLLVFNNAGTPEQLYPYLPSGPGRTLVTTRDETWTSKQRLLFSLDKLPRSSVVAWLGDAFADADPETLGELADRLDGLPLGVIQAIAYIGSRPGETPGSYLAKLNTKEGRQEVLAANPPPGYPAALATTWNVAIDAVSSEAPAAVELLRYLAYVGPDNMPVPLLEGLLVGHHATDLLHTLRRYGMIHCTATVVSVHRLVQDVTRWPLHPAEEAGYIARWAAHLRARSPAAVDHANLGWYDEIAPHVLVLADIAARLGVAPPDLAVVARLVAVALVEQASYSTARLLLERLLAAGETARGLDDPSIAATLDDLGAVHHALGDHGRAVELLARSLVIKQRTSGPETS